MPDNPHNSQEKVAAISPKNIQMFQKQTLLLLVVLKEKDNPNGLELKHNMRVGAIVMAKSWQNRDYAAIYGELVFVGNISGQLEIIQTGEVCTVNKKRPIACVAHIKNNVLVPLQPKQFMSSLGINQGLSGTEYVNKKKHLGEN